MSLKSSIYDATSITVQDMLIKCYHSFLLFGLLLIAALVSSCGGYVKGDPQLVPELVTASLPYIEAVHMPEQIHSGEPFSITLELSSELNPAALRGPERPFIGFDLEYGIDAGATAVVYRPFRDLSYSTSSEPIRQTIVFSVSSLSVGQHTFVYFSAPSRDQGGMSFKLDNRTKREIDDLSNMVRQQTFTVLP